MEWLEGKKKEGREGKGGGDLSCDSAQRESRRDAAQLVHSQPENLVLFACSFNGAILSLALDHVKGR